jgi:hypothetical protein
MKHTLKSLILCIIGLLVYVTPSGAAFRGPTILIEGEWGNADNQFGLERGDSWDEQPTLDGILGDGSIVISDLANNRTVIYKSNGIFKEKEIWIPQPAEKGMIKYVHKKYLLGCCVQGYDAKGNLWTGNADKYALTGKDGTLITKVDARPPELGVIVKQRVNSNYQITINYPDKTYTIVTETPYEKIQRESSDKLNAITNKFVTKFNNCGEAIGTLIFPVSKSKQIRAGGGGFEEVRELIEEYGAPIIGYNGDIYTWKRTPQKFSILKWTWVEEQADIKKDCSPQDAARTPEKKSN